jgi:hypothetical protein
MRACAFDELLLDPSRLRTRIDDEYKPACLAEDVGRGYMGNMQNCVSSSITKGTKSLVSPMMGPGLGPSRTHRCPCFLAQTCEKSILAAVGITQASLMPEVIKTFDQMLVLFYRRLLFALLRVACQCWGLTRGCLRASPGGLPRAVAASRGRPPVDARRRLYVRVSGSVGRL